MSTFRLCVPPGKYHFEVKWVPVKLVFLFLLYVGLPVTWLRLASVRLACWLRVVGGGKRTVWYMGSGDQVKMLDGSLTTPGTIYMFEVFVCRFATRRRWCYGWGMLCILIESIFQSLYLNVTFEDFVTQPPLNNHVVKRINLNPFWKTHKLTPSE